MREIIPIFFLFSDLVGGVCRLSERGHVPVGQVQLRVHGGPPPTPGLEAVQPDTAPPQADRQAEGHPAYHLRGRRLFQKSQVRNTLKVYTVVTHCLGRKNQRLGHHFS